MNAREVKLSMKMFLIFYDRTQNATLYNRTHHTVINPTEHVSENCNKGLH